MKGSLARVEASAQAEDISILVAEAWQPVKF